MPSAPTTGEAQLRTQLESAVTNIRVLLGRCPFVDEVDHLDSSALDETTSIIDDLAAMLLDAERVTDELAALEAMSHEAISIVATSRTAIGVVRAVLATVAAAIDAQAAA